MFFTSFKVKRIWAAKTELSRLLGAPIIDLPGIYEQEVWSWDRIISEVAKLVNNSKK